MAETSQETLWNSLEIAKLLVSGLTPVVVIIVGFWVDRRLKNIEHLQWANQRITEKRIAVFDESAPLLNDLLVFFTYVGSWHELTPPDIIKHKRDLDRTFHIYAPLFSEKVRADYDHFIALCFHDYSGWGQDAKLRTLSERRKQAAGGSWDSDWDNYFSAATDVPDPNEIRGSYKRLMIGFAAELGIGMKPKDVPAGMVPSNIK